MSRQMACGGVFPAGLGLAAGFLLGLFSFLPAAEPVAEPARLRAQLDAGEFAPAVEEAGKLPRLEERDHCLAQIAVAQAQAGARDASLNTASGISDDRTRTDALSQAGKEPLGGRGGAGMADFGSLIDLITTTIQPTTWDEVGGPGSIKEFPTGVHVEPQGLLRPLLKEEQSDRLAVLRQASASESQPGERAPALDAPHGLAAAAGESCTIAPGRRPPADRVHAVARRTGANPVRLRLCRFRRRRLGRHAGRHRLGRASRRLDPRSGGPHRERGIGTARRATGRFGGRLPPHAQRSGREVRLHDQSSPREPREGAAVSGKIEQGLDFCGWARARGSSGFGRSWAPRTSKCTADWIRACAPRG